MELQQSHNESIIVDKEELISRVQRIRQQLKRYQEKDDHNQNLRRWLYEYLEYALDRLKYGKKDLDEDEMELLDSIASLSSAYEIDGQIKEVDLEVLDKDRLKKDGFKVVTYRGRHFAVKIRKADYNWIYFVFGFIIVVSLISKLLS